MPPTTLSFRCSTAELRMGAADLSFATLSITFCRIALSRASPGVPETAFTAGVRLVTREGRWPGSVVLSLSDLMVASTAPQASWPSTMMRGVPSMATAYSMLAIVSLLAQLPATRQTNRSPLPLSKAYSGAMRESAQLRCRHRDSGLQPVLHVHA